MNQQGECHVFGTVVAPPEIVTSRPAKRLTLSRGVAEAAQGRRLQVDRSLSAFRDVRVIRSILAVVALVLAAYCLIAAATALYAQPAPGNPDPAELASRERYRWPGWIPIVFLAIIAGYAVAIAARRRGRRGLPSTQDPPGTPPAHQHRDTRSR
jgi:hypothetical protein